MNSINWQNEHHGNQFCTFFNSAYADADKKGPAVYTARALLRGLDALRQEYMNECEKVYPNSMSNRQSEQPISSEYLKSNNEVISVKPNPAKNNIIINHNGIYTNLGIEEISGKLVFTQVLNQTVNMEQIDVSNLSNGLYLVKLSNEYNSTILKLVINK